TRRTSKKFEGFFYSRHSSGSSSSSGSWSSSPGLSNHITGRFLYDPPAFSDAAGGPESVEGLVGMESDGRTRLSRAVLSRSNQRDQMRSTWGSSQRFRSKFLTASSSMPRSVASE